MERSEENCIESGDVLLAVPGRSHRWARRILSLTLASCDAKRALDSLGDSRHGHGPPLIGSMANPWCLAW